MTRARVIPKYHCVKCDALTTHIHLHDTAYNIPETHMAGTERYVCEACYHTTHVNDAPTGAFPFYLEQTSSGPIMNAPNAPITTAKPILLQPPSVLLERSFGRRENLRHRHTDFGRNRSVRHWDGARLHQLPSGSNEGTQTSDRKAPLDVRLAGDRRLGRHGRNGLENWEVSTLKESQKSKESEKKRRGSRRRSSSPPSRISDVNATAIIMAALLLGMILVLWW